METAMEHPQAVLDAFHSFSQPIRLSVCQILIRREPRGMTAGEMAAELGLSQNGLSYHLKALRKAGLVTSRTVGRYAHYRADAARVSAVVDYLVKAFGPMEPNSREACVPPLPFIIPESVAASFGWKPPAQGTVAKPDFPEDDARIGPGHTVTSEEVFELSVLKAIRLMGDDD